MGRKRNQGDQKHVHGDVFGMANRFALSGLLFSLRRSGTLGNRRQVFIIHFSFSICYYCV
jgi:hypothetical protein